MMVLATESPHLPFVWLEVDAVIVSAHVQKE